VRVYVERQSLFLDFCFVVLPRSFSPGHLHRSDPWDGRDYATTDLRLTRRIYAGDRAKLELMAESFNLLNRDNKRVSRSRRTASSATRHSSFRRIKLLESISFLPNIALPSSFLHTTEAYAPRQIQLALKLLF
jgi:hypothetical protein